MHRGEWLLFSATGDVSWAARKETTTADGTHGMPGFVGAGGLVGRIAGTTRSFPIGARTQPYRVNLRSRATKPAPPIRMPADGVLELGFKDYVAGDNTGELVVTIKEGR